jgi:hypothetical protein
MGLLVAGVVVVILLLATLTPSLAGQTLDEP